MNKAFKAIWSDVRQSFVTTSEIQPSHGKRSKSELLGVAYTQIRNPDSNLSLLGRS